MYLLYLIFDYIFFGVLMLVFKPNALRLAFELSTTRYRNFDSAQYRTLKSSSAERQEAMRSIHAAAPTTYSLWDLISIPRGEHKMYSIDNMNLACWGHLETIGHNGRINYSVTDAMFSSKSLVHVSIYSNGRMDSTNLTNYDHVLHLWARQTPEKLIVSSARLISVEDRVGEKEDRFPKFTINKMPKTDGAIKSTILCMVDMYEQIRDCDGIAWDATVDRYKGMSGRDVEASFDRLFGHLVLR